MPLDVRQPDWESLRFFLEVARSASFRGAATRLGMTGHGIARRIEQLEHQVGAVLFTRHRDGVRLTAVGNELLSLVERMDETSREFGRRSQLNFKPPAVPAQQPAAVEPIWTDDRLSLPTEPATPDLESTTFAAALKSLRDELRAFVDEVAGEANIDRRLVSRLDQLASQIPETVPLQAELFRLGHFGATFAGYASTVNEQWPEFLAARYHSIALHFDRTMRGVSSCVTPQNKP